MKRSMILVAALATAWAVSAAPSFRAARSVWPKGRESRMNDFVEFRASFDAKEGDAPVLRVTGCSVYRIRLNGKFSGYGPARAAKGFFRVDEWPLAAKAGRNDLAIEVSAYNCKNFYIPAQAPFLQAEVVVGDRVLAATGADLRDFRAYETPRVAKCSRYSYQRAFGEAYRLGTAARGRAALPGTELPLAEGPQARLLDRIAPYPKFEVIAGLRPASATEVSWKEPETFRKARWVDDTQPWVDCYKPAELEVNLWRELQCASVRRVSSAPDGAVPAGRGVQYDAGINTTGFIGLDVECRKAGTLYVAFDEILMDGVVDPSRYTACNIVRYDMAPGRHRVESFEPYTFRHIHVYAVDGDFSVSNVFVRTYRSPTADDASFKSSDAAVDAIFKAAKETYAQNAVDVLSDCPGRERAGWLCDSFFTGRTAVLLAGSTDLERLFIQNYLLPESFGNIPEGMLPMCYPSDHGNGRYIPNWAMWFVIQVGEYLERSGDRATVDALRPRLEKLVGYLWKYRNADGLLEKLQSWVFVEWSKANDYVQDVSYPSNATWAEVLDAMDRMYARPDLAAEARRVREAIRRQSWTGKWFCDNAVRQKDGTLKLSGNCTETCQYYMFMFGVATRESHPALWKTLLDDFGPERRRNGKFPEIAFSNAFIGNLLRLELLSRAGCDRQLLDETKGYYHYMAERTGTLWEYISDWKSCNHGFASYVAVLYTRSLLGVEKVDVREKTVTVRRTDVPLECCEATFPVPGGEVTYGWKKTDGRREETFRAPPGWKMRSLPNESEAASFRIRDPFILVDAKTRTYFLYGVEHYMGEPCDTTGVWVRKSKDLKNWSEPVHAMTAPKSIQCVWAPEVHEYKGAYYMFATLKEYPDKNHPLVMMGPTPDWSSKLSGLAASWHATWIYRAERPEGPFLPVSGKPVTPPGWVALDGTLAVEDGKPYIVFTHDWAQVADGTIELAPLTDDLSAVSAPPRTLFKASTIAPGTLRGVTDGPFVYRSPKSGKLFITWSTHNPAKLKDGLPGYCVVSSESASGRLEGPWINHHIIFDENGGHGMVFRALDGSLKFILHNPEIWGSERLAIYDFADDGEKISISQAVGVSAAVDSPSGGER